MEVKEIKMKGIFANIRDQSRKDSHVSTHIVRGVCVKATEYSSSVAGGQIHHHLFLCSLTESL